MTTVEDGETSLAASSDEGEFHVAHNEEGRASSHIPYKHLDSHLDGIDAKSERGNARIPIGGESEDRH